VTKTGPNDARCASFGPLVSFFFFSIVLILANIFYVYIGYEIRDRELEGGGNISGPKRRRGVVWAIMISKCSFFFTSIFIILTNVLFYI
jgi:hypothetical protein